MARNAANPRACAPPTRAKGRATSTGGCGGRLKHGQRSKYLKPLWRKIGEVYREGPATYDFDDQIAVQVGILNRKAAELHELEKAASNGKELGPEQRQAMAELSAEVFGLSSVICKNHERRARISQAAEERVPVKIVVQNFKWVLEVVKDHVKDEGVVDAIFGTFEKGLRPLVGAGHAGVGGEPPDGGGE